MTPGCRNLLPFSHKSFIEIGALSFDKVWLAIPKGVDEVEVQYSVYASQAPLNQISMDLALCCKTVS